MDVDQDQETPSLQGRKRAGVMVLWWIGVESGLFVVATAFEIEGLIGLAEPESIALAGAVEGVGAAVRQKRLEGMREGRRGMERRIERGLEEGDVALDRWPSSEVCLHLVVGQRETQREDQRASSSCVVVAVVAVVEGADRGGGDDMRQDLFVQGEIVVGIEVGDKMDGERPSCDLEAVDEDQTQRMLLDQLWHHLHQEEWKKQEEKVEGIWVEC